MFFLAYVILLLSYCFQSEYRLHHTWFNSCTLLSLSLVPSGAREHRQCDVFRASRSRWLRHLLQPPGRPRPLLHHSLQLLWGDSRRNTSPHSEGHLVSATGATAAYCVELLPLVCTRGKKHFIFFHSEVSTRLVFDMMDVFSCMPQCLWGAIDAFLNFWWINESFF